MGRRNLTPEEKARKEQIRGLVNGLEIKDFNDIRALFKEMTADIWKTGWKASLTNSWANQV